MLAYRAKKAYVFNSVLKNFRCISATASRSKFLGFHVGLLAIRNQRTLSAPYLLRTSKGSTVFPLLFDIFWPFLSRMRSLQMTFWKHGSLNRNVLMACSV